MISKLNITALAAASLLAAAEAFTIDTKAATRCQTARYVSLHNDGHKSLDAVGAPEDYVNRARECADSFGKCDVNELRVLRDELHSERVKGVLFGDALHTVTEEELEHHMLEEELSLQLQLLQDENPPTTLFADIEENLQLFPEVEEDMTELPHLKDGTAAVNAAEIVEQRQNRFWMDKLMEEGVIESLEFCALIALASILPGLVMN